MFNVRDLTTAGINILGAIDALESALARAQSDTDTILVTEREKELVCQGLVDARFVLAAHSRPVPSIISLLALTLTDSRDIARDRAAAALKELRLTEALAEADLDASVPAIAA